MPIKFTVDGDSELTSRTPRCVTAGIAALEALPLGKLLTTRSLASRIGVGVSFFATQNGHSAFIDFKEKDGVRTLWGSRKTIGELRKLKNPHAKESPPPKT